MATSGAESVDALVLVERRLLLRCLDRIDERRDLVESARCLVNARNRDHTQTTSKRLAQSVAATADAKAGDGWLGSFRITADDDDESGKNGRNNANSATTKRRRLQRLRINWRSTTRSPPPPFADATQTLRLSPTRSSRLQRYKAATPKTQPRSRNRASCNRQICKVCKPAWLQILHASRKESSGLEKFRKRVVPSPSHTRSFVRARARRSLSWFGEQGFKSLASSPYDRVAPEDDKHWKVDEKRRTQTDKSASFRI